VEEEVGFKPKTSLLLALPLTTRLQLGLCLKVNKILFVHKSRSYMGCLGLGSSRDPGERKRTQGPAVKEKERDPYGAHTS